MIKNEEFRFYFLYVSIICLILAGLLFLSENSITFKTFTDAVFSTISIITSTGHTTADFGIWSHQALALLFCTTVVGSCAGSCGGGIKIIRAIICFKYLKSEITKILHPNAVINIKIDNNVVSKEVRRQVLTFIVFYFLIFMITLAEIFAKLNQTSTDSTASTGNTTGQSSSLQGTIGDLSVDFQQSLMALLSSDTKGEEETSALKDNDENEKMI